MINANTVYNVLNRSSSMVGYTIPELNIRREFQPGETKKIKFSELEQLTYQPGGTTLIQDYFLIREQEVTDALNIQTEIEYYMNEDNVRDLILNGSLDQFLDCLDFAPEGVIEMIKKLAIELPMNDVEKREALKKKTGFDVDAAIKNKMAETVDEGASATSEAPHRRVQESANEAPVRRAEAPKYTVKK